MVLINPTDYSLYLPLLPEVAAGILEPRRVSEPLAATLPGVRLVLGIVEVVDLDARRVTLVDPEGHHRAAADDRLLLAVGSVTRLLPVPRGGRGRPRLPQRRRSLVPARPSRAPAGAGGQLRRPRRAAARCTFMVVGAGYTGTEVAAHGQRVRQLLPLLVGAMPRVPSRVEWLRAELLKTRAAHGYCARELVAGACPHANICEQCDNFIPSPEFLPALHDQLADIRTLHANAEQRGGHPRPPATPT